jgi:hypothetical protein
LQEDGAGAEGSDRAEIVTDKKNGPATFGYVSDSAQAFFLKLSIPDGEDFIDYENLRFEVSSHGESEAHVHATAVAFDGSVQKLIDLSKSDDLVESRCDLLLFHSQHGPVKEDVLPPGEFGVESGADLEKRRDAPPQTDASTGGLCDTGQDFEKSGLPCTIASNDPEDLP